MTMNYMIRFVYDSLVNPIRQQCKTRMNTLPENLQGGMGDIFVSMAILND